MGKLKIVLGLASAAAVIAAVLRFSEGETARGLVMIGAAAAFLLALFLTGRG